MIFDGGREKSRVFECGLFLLRTFPDGYLPCVQGRGTALLRGGGVIIVKSE